MTYILSGTKGSKGSASDQAILAAGNALLSSVGETIKQGIKNGLTRYEVYNLVRFNDAKIKDPKLTQRMNKGDYLPPFKAYRAAVGFALKASRFNAPVPAKDINDAAFEGFKMVYNAALGIEDKKEDKGKAQAKTAEDNTLLYVGVLAVGAFALMQMQRQRK